MPLHRFFRHQLRTTDIDAARQFYGSVLGEAPADISLLPAVARPGEVPAQSPVLWHLLNTPAIERSLAAYAAVFGWRRGALLDLGELGSFQLLAFGDGEPPAASLVDITGLPGRHPHWLFHFAVSDLDAAVFTVQRERGLVAGTFELPGGDRLAVCDDAQGAAFTIRQRAR